MFQLIQRLRLLFGFQGERSTDDSRFDAMLHKEFARLREVDPQTQQQWLNLRRAIADNKAEVPIKPRSALRYALGAAVVLMALVGGYVYLTSIQPPAEMFATGKGQQKEVPLKDGSEVILSYATELIVTRLQPAAPRRLLLRGEAYFRVRPNGTPFIVSTDYADVHVVGTEFDLRSRGGVLEVGVVSGTVRLSVSRNGKDTSLLLSQHQRALCLQNSIPERIEDISSAQYPGWMHGKLFLNRTLLPEVCREIEMRFDVSIRIDSPEIRGETVTGILDARSSESALSAICELTGKRFTHEGEVYILY